MIFEHWVCTSYTISMPTPHYTTCDQDVSTIQNNTISAHNQGDTAATSSLNSPPPPPQLRKKSGMKSINIYVTWAGEPVPTQPSPPSDSARGWHVCLLHPIPTPRIINALDTPTILLNSFWFVFFNISLIKEFSTPSTRDVALLGNYTKDMMMIFLSLSLGFIC